MRWLLFILGSLATFRLSHLVAKERGPFAVFERLRNAMPGGRGSARNGLVVSSAFLSLRARWFA
jgi:hypothetical protein